MNEILNRQQCLEVLSGIACDTEERTQERLKAIELLVKLKEEETPRGVVVIDDLGQYA